MERRGHQGAPRAGIEDFVSLDSFDGHAEPLLE
jgi:hypothetical protein